jgi:hypothetical protein
MERSTRTTRSKVSPGQVDRPPPRRSSAVVTQEKAKKQQAAKLKAEELRRRAARVSEVEREVRKAQEEGPSAKQNVAKKTFPRLVAGVNVSRSDPSMHICDLTNFHVSPRTPPPPHRRLAEARETLMPWTFLSLSRP